MKIQKRWNLPVLVAVVALMLPSLAGAYPAEVPRTGQTTCYDTAGNVITCAGTGQDGEYQAGVAWPNPRFIDNGDTVTDKLTGLEWTKDANSAPYSMTWQEALDYVKTLNTGGYNDWRLPNVNELESLINVGPYNPALPQALPQGHPFTNVQSSKYWSSTSIAYYTGYAWFVNMGYGYVYGGNIYDGFKSDYGWVWPVRTGQCGALGNSVICLPKTGQTMCYNSSGTAVTCAGTGQDGDIQAGVAWPSPRFVDHGDGTVTDNLTGLEWTKDANPAGTVNTMTWQQALDYVKTLNTGGHSDWRLPNRRELRSLVDYSRYNSALPQGHPFTNVHSDYYWSSTSYVYVPSSAWFFLPNGNSYDGGSSKASGYGYVWPVRSGQCGAFGNLVISQTPMSGPPGTNFDQWGTGGTPSGKVTLHFKKPDGSEYPTQTKTMDRSGHFIIPYTASSDIPAGIYSWWAVDETTHQKSNEVSFEITGGTYPAIVEVIDPQVSASDFFNDFYQLQGKASSLYGAMATGGTTLNPSKIAADGVTKLIVRANVGGLGQVNFQLGASDRGTVGAIDGSGSQGASFSAQVVHTNNGYKAYAVYTAPADFTANTNDNTVSKSVLLSVMYKKEGGISIITLRDIDITIVRPPVVLVHGIWSSFKEAFVDDGFNTRLQDKFNSGLTIEPIDYKNSDGLNTGNARHFSWNEPFINAGIIRAIRKMRNLGVAVTQVDYICHSMGGDLGRLESQADKKPINYYEGYFHKFITIDTPHTGSWLASTIWELNGPGSALPGLARIAGKPIDLGAIEDLYPCSAALRDIHTTDIPSHAIVGRYTPTVNVCAVIFPPLIIGGFFGWGCIGLELPNFWDLVVTVGSQQGGISSSAQSEFDHAHSNLPGLFAWSESTPVTNRVSELLNSPVGSSTFGTFPAVSSLCSAGSGAARLTAHDSMVLQRKVYRAPTSPTDPYIAITSPMQGQTFSSGSLVPVTVVGYNTTLQKVLIVGKDNVREITAEPFTDGITIPSDFAGDFEIGAAGIDSDNSVLIADSLTITITPTATLVAIATMPDSVFIDDGDTSQLAVNGLYSDNITRDITAATIGTTYSSDNEAIATVSTNGNISGVAVGSANITITNGAVSAIVPVTVEQAPAALTALIATDNITVLTGTDQLPLSAFITSGKDVDQAVQYWFTLTLPDNSTTPVGAATPLTLAAHASWSKDTALTLPLNGAGWYTLTLTATNDTGGEAEAKFDFAVEESSTTTTIAPTTTTLPSTTTIQLTTTTTLPMTTTTAVTSTTTIPTTTTTTISGPCPAKTALNTEHSGILTIYHKFRDARLAKTDEGRRLTELYYKHGAEVSQILATQDGLRIEVRRLLLSLAPDMFLGMYKNKELSINKSQQRHIFDCITRLKKTASPELKADIDALLVRMSDESLQNELGYKIR